MIKEEKRDDILSSDGENQRRRSWCYQDQKDHQGRVQAVHGDQKDAAHLQVI